MFLSTAKKLPFLVTTKNTCEETEHSLDLLLDYSWSSCRMPEARAVDKDVVLAINLDGDTCRKGGPLGECGLASRFRRDKFVDLPSSSLCPSRRSSPVINFTRLVFPAPTGPMTRMILLLSSSPLPYY